MGSTGPIGTARTWARRNWYLPAAVIVGASGGVVLVSAWLYLRTASYRYREVAQVPPRHTAIILGASVYRSGRPSAMLRDRLDTALELYHAGKVTKLLVTGHGGRGYNEVAVMRRHVLKGGARPADVFVDPAGFTTYESMLRARGLFQVEQAVVVTQAFHLPRAVYLARQLGIAAVGVDADRRPYGNIWRPHLRELLARVKGFVEVRRPLDGARLGGSTPITGDGRATWPGRGRR